MEDVITNHWFIKPKIPSPADDPLELRDLRATQRAEVVRTEVEAHRHRRFVIAAFVEEQLRRVMLEGVLSVSGLTAISLPLLENPLSFTITTVKKSCLKATQFVRPSNFRSLALVSLR
ncbi:MAG: hypothetical protein IPP83_00100 [Flavobacteriales bacterium]|nr:hypothetical protein [Flavobacteriales bacterium]